MDVLCLCSIYIVYQKSPHICSIHFLYSVLISRARSIRPPRALTYPLFPDDLHPWLRRWGVFLWFGVLFEFGVFQFFFEDAACDKADFGLFNDARIDVFFLKDAFGFERNMEITKLAQVHAMTFG